MAPAAFPKLDLDELNLRIVFYPLFLVVVANITS
jgi:hypothetical protein